MDLGIAIDDFIKNVNKKTDCPSFEVCKTLITEYEDIKSQVFEMAAQGTTVISIQAWHGLR